MEALTFRWRGLEESSLVITKAETQQIIGSIGSGIGVGIDPESLDIKDKNCIENKENEKISEKWNQYERYDSDNRRIVKQ